MACDAQSVETLLVNTDKYYSLSQRQWLEWLAQLVINAAGITVTAAINLAATNKMAALSDRNLEECRIAAFTAALFDAQSIINEIATQKYPSLDRHDLMCATIAAYCAAAGGSAQTVETLSVGNGYFKLSQRDDTLAIDAVICAANSVNCTNVTAVALSVGITGMSDRHLKEVICALASNDAAPPCATPTGLAATWNIDRTLSVSWDAVPAGMDNTEVWISEDNMVFVLADVVVAPGTTSHTGALAFDPFVKIRFTINHPSTNCPFTASVHATDACVVPTGLTAVWNIDTTTLVTWDAVPAGPTSTQVWSSLDNITFMLAATVAAPGTTTTLGATVSAPYVEIRFCV